MSKPIIPLESHQMVEAIGALWNWKGTGAFALPHYRTPRGQRTWKAPGTQAHEKP